MVSNANTRIEEISEVLRNLIDIGNGAYQFASVVSVEGLPIAMYSPSGNVFDMPVEEFEGELGKYVSTLAKQADLIGVNIIAGELEQFYIELETGYFFIVSAGEVAVLAMLTIKTVKLGLVFVDAGRATRKIADILQ